MRTMGAWLDRLGGATVLLFALSGAALAAEPVTLAWPEGRLRPKDIFELEWAEDPQISPDGGRIVYVRRGFDVMTDRARSALWTVRWDGREHRPLLDPSIEGARAPRWSPDGSRILFSAKGDRGAQLYVASLDGAPPYPVTHVEAPPREATWAPSGAHIAFVMRVKAPSTPMVKRPEKPEGAEWAPPAEVVEQVVYRRDGQGRLEEGYDQIFVVPAEGGTARALTSGPFSHGAPRWAPDGRTIFFEGRRDEDWMYDPLDTEIHAVDVNSGELTTLTDRQGPDEHPTPAKKRDLLAYVGFEDRRQGYQVSKISLMRTDGAKKRVLETGLDRTPRQLAWAGGRLYFAFDDRGRTKIASTHLEGEVQVHAEDVGGTTLGRPYASGSFSVHPTGRIVFTLTGPQHPADLAVVDDGEVRRLTRLNADLLEHRALGEITSIEAEAPDGEAVQGWWLEPPGFDPETPHPLILEIHGGPFANYGPRFAAELQLYAAAGYVVLFANPRGSTSYGERFGNLIHHAYPGDDYGDLMALVDQAAARPGVDAERLFVTGGSGGGVLTAWIVGKTDRFRAAVVAKPVINWASFVLYADLSPFFTRYWFPAPPWEDPTHYWARSPLSLVGRVTTPTMLLTGEADFRTPIAESEQYYQALKLREVDTALVRIPEASHGIARRPSHLLAKVHHILAWFARHDRPAP
jgi:acylaminoacyl-peptidase